MCEIYSLQINEKIKPIQEYEAYNIFVVENNLNQYLNEVYV